ncbi:MAG: biopolymer transporter ExbD [Pseudomonadota bacterium]
MHIRRIGGPRKNPEPLLPLINVVFLLLIFFMLAGRLTAPDAFWVQVPESASQSHAQAEAITILVGQDGRIVLEGLEIENNGLLLAVRNEVEDHPERQVQIKADRGVEAVKVVSILDTLREAGVEKLRLLTELPNR